jgi:hypothetical protein
MTLRKMLAALCIAVMVVGGIAATLYVLMHKEQLLSSPQAARSASLQPPEPSVPTPDEFKVGIDVTAQDCPAAGKCVFTYSISPNYVGKHPLPDQAFTVFYEVRGGFTSQPGTFTVNNGQAKMLKDVQIEGSQGAQLEVVVTQISAVAGPKPVS